MANNCLCTLNESLAVNAIDLSFHALITHLKCIAIHLLYVYLKYWLSLCVCVCVCVCAEVGRALCQTGWCVRVGEWGRGGGGLSVCTRNGQTVSLADDVMFLRAYLY